MKKILYAFLLLGCSSVATAQTITVSEKNSTMVMMYTESTSNDCGTFGWDTFRELIDSNVNAVCVNWYGSGDTKLTIAPVALNASLLAIYTPAVSVVPSFLINSVNLSYVNYSGVKSFIQSNTAGPVVVNTGFEQSVNSTGDSLIIDTKTEFFQNATGEYYVATYVYEDTVIAPQTGQGTNAAHINVWRTPTGIEGAFGSKLQGASFSKGHTFDTTYRIYIDPSWNKDRLKAFTVTWEKNGGFYTIANAYEKPRPTAGINDKQLQQTRTAIYPNPVVNEIHLQPTGHKGDCRVSLYDISGKRLAQLHHGPVNTGTLILKKPTAISSGLYYITISSDAGTETRKITIQ